MDEMSVIGEPTYLSNPPESYMAIIVNSVFHTHMLAKKHYATRHEREQYRRHLQETQLVALHANNPSLSRYTSIVHYVLYHAGGSRP